MRDHPKSTKPAAAPIRDGGALLLAAGGLAAAFGAASCCALPLILASLGVSATWLAAIAWFAAPYRIVLLTLAVAAVAVGGALLWRQRARACATGGSRSRNAVISAAGLAMLSIAAILAAMGMVFA